MRTTNTGTTDLHALSAASQVRRIRLLEVDMTPVGASDLLLAEAKADVEFPTGSGNVYQAVPMRLDQVSENNSGRVDSIRVRMALTDAIAGFLELYGALQGHRVTLREVFPTALGDGDAKLEDVFEIDSASANKRVVDFTLVSVLDSHNLRIAPRKYSTTFCPWEYKGRGCWQDDGEGGFEAPSGFVAGSPDTCGKTREECQRHSNFARFGGFAGVPKKRSISV